MKRLNALFICIMTLTGCNQQPGAQQTTADALDNAAQQSDPHSAAVLQNAADDARNKGLTENLSDPDSFAQDALENAGEGQNQ